MSPKEYQKLALTLAKRKGFEFDFRHAVYGLITEVGEIVDVFKRLHAYDKPIDTVNLCEEVGDCLWYIALGCDVVGASYEDLIRATTAWRQTIMEDDVARSALALARDAGGFGHIATMEPIAGEWVRTEFERAAVSYLRHLGIICVGAKCTLADAMEANIRKLSKRYPDLQFSAERALNRDLAAERAELEARN